MYLLSDGLICGVYSPSYFLLLALITEKVIGESRETHKLSPGKSETRF